MTSVPVASVFYWSCSDVTSCFFLSWEWVFEPGQFGDSWSWLTNQQKCCSQVSSRSAWATQSEHVSKNKNRKRVALGSCRCWTLNCGRFSCCLRVYEPSLVPDWSPGSNWTLLMWGQPVYRWMFGRSCGVTTQTVPRHCQASFWRRVTIWWQLS
jgi:hypothetical protein